MWYIRVYGSALRHEETDERTDEGICGLSEDKLDTSILLVTNHKGDPNPQETFSANMTQNQRL
jgi:hypothetical protein